MKSNLLSTILIIFLLGISYNSVATVLTVANTNDSGAGSLREACTLANSGDTIHLDASLIIASSDTILLLTEIPITKSLTIIGAYNATDTLFISSLSNSRAFNVNLGSETNQSLYLDSLVIFDCRDNSPTDNGGGAIKIINVDSLRIANSVFRNNRSTTSGGAIHISDSTITEIIFESCTFHSNRSSGNGGAIFFNNSFASSLSLVDCRITANTANSSQGGAIAYSCSNGDSGTASLIITGSTFDSNGSTQGGALSLRHFLGAIDLNIRLSTFSNNAAQIGGAIFYTSDYTGTGASTGLSIDESNFQSNFAGSEGGAIYHTTQLLDPITSTIERSTFSANSASSTGGALHVHHDSTTAGILDISYSTFVSNFADVAGGAVNYTNSFGGIKNVLTGCTFHSNNIAIVGGSIIYLTSFSGTADAEFSNNILFDDGTNSWSMGPYNVLLSEYNIYEDPSPTGASASDQVGVSPASVNLGALQNNGGFGPTMLPGTGSVAIDMGDPTNPDDAQNSPIIGIRDIGAAEFAVNTYDTLIVSSCDSMVSPSGNYTWASSGTYYDTIADTSGFTFYTINLTIDEILNQSLSTVQFYECDTSAVTVDLASSETGVSYYLRHAINDSIIDGPIAGTGSALSLNTDMVTSTTTYNVFAQRASGGLQFDGVDDYVSISTVVPATEITNEFWFKTTVPTQGMFSVLDTDLGPAFDRDIHLVGGDIEVYLFTPALVRMSTTGTNYADGEWHHVAMVLSSNGFFLYVDGVVQASLGEYASAFTSNTVVNVGFSQDANVGANKHFNGTIDEVRLWNVERTASEIQSNMHSCLTGSEPGLSVYLQLNESSGVVASNTTGGPDGNLVNFPAAPWTEGVGNCGCGLQMSDLVTLNIANASTATHTVITCGSFTVPSGDETYTVSGTYTDTIPNMAGCDSIITINLTVNNATTGTDVITACDSYTWIDGITYTASNNTATHTLANAMGCDSVVTIDLTINSLDLTVTDASPTLTANEAGVSYQWIDCDNGNMPIAGETGQSYNATANGNYAVILDDGICLDTTACTSVTGIGIDEMDIEVNLYPNPFNDWFTVQLTGTQASYSLTVLDLQGRIVYTSGEMRNRVAIDLTNEAPGTYLLRIDSESGTTVRRIVKY